MSDELNKQGLSDLMDGHADAPGVSRACAAWRSDAKAREDWHLYHVIGDVLRTPELAPRARSRAAFGTLDTLTDSAFLAAVRTRLALEPVVLAPEPVPEVASPGSLPRERSAAGLPQARSRMGWRAPMAVAAGFMSVAAVIAVTRMGGLGADPTAPVLASNVSATSTVLTVATVPPSQSVGSVGGAVKPSAAPVMLVNDQRMVRDARLDRYLAAHRQFGDGPVGALPGGVVRSVSSTAPER